MTDISTIEFTTVVNCGDCGARMRLIPSKKTGRVFWGCVRFPQCDGAHSAHPDGRPMGEPADKPTREARKRVHEAFDWLWRGGHMGRTQAYEMLADRLGLSVEDCHVSLFDLSTCEIALQALAKFQFLKGATAGNAPNRQRKKAFKVAKPKPRSSNPKPNNRPKAKRGTGPMPVVIYKKPRGTT